ncbi:MAG: hypothetical protein QXH08_00550, partial [Candidatus Hadarchaeales archaeon]
RFLESCTVSEVLSRIEEVKRCMSSILRWAAAEAFVEVGKRASDFFEEQRLEAVKNLLSKNFSTGVRTLEASVRVAGIGLDFQPDKSWVEISEVENRHVKVRVEFPEAVISYSSPDGNLKMKIPVRAIESFLDARYFLLQEKMRTFLERLDEVSLVWMALEYGRGWGEAITTGIVEQNEEVSKELFRVAWAAHEYNTFGSFDYLGAAAEIGEKAKNLIFSGRSIQQDWAGGLKALAERLEKAGEKLKEAERLLVETVEGLALAEGHLRDNSRENFLATVGLASQNLRAACSRMNVVEKELNLFLEDAASLSAKDPIMNALLSGIFRRNIHQDLPSMKEQVEWAINAISKTIGEVLLSENMSGSGLASAREKILAVLKDEGPVKWVEVKSYEDNPPREVRKRLPIYVSEGGGKTIPNLLMALGGGGRELREIAKLAGESYKPFDQSFREFLKTSWNDLGLSRENIYLVSPPPPIKDEPELSVFHQLNLGDVKFSRQDLAGMLGAKSATPIYLPVINLVLWWGQWEVRIKMEGGVERIFDFQNQALLQPSILGHSHAPLSYRWVLGEKEFRTTVVIMSPRYFEIV